MTEFLPSMAVPNYLTEQAIWSDDYFDPDHWKRLGKGRRNSLLKFEPNNTYETWLAHAAIPHAFKSFICNPDIVGRAELAIYLRICFWMDQFGVCYPTLDEVAEDVFKQSRQAKPVLDAIINKHLILRSGERVRIPWMTSKKTEARFVLQRPSAAHTIIRLHFDGFRDRDKVTYLPKDAYIRSMDTLQEAYKSKDLNAFIEKGESHFAALTWCAHVKDAPGFRKWVAENFLQGSPSFALISDKGTNSLLS